MAAAKSFVQMDFRGGINTNLPVCAPDQSADLVNVDLSSGALAALRSPAKVAVADSCLNSFGDILARNHGVYVTSAGVSYPLKKLDRSVWVGLPQNVYDRYIGGSTLANWEMQAVPSGGNYTDYGVILDCRDIGQVDLWSGRVARFNGITSHMTHVASGTRPENWFDFTGNPFSFSVWVCLEPGMTSGTTRSIISKFDQVAMTGYEFNVTPGSGTSGILSFFTYANAGDYWQATTDSIATLCDGNWHHIVAARFTTGENLMIFYDGTRPSQSTSGTFSPINADNTELFTIGAHSFYHDLQPFRGLLGCVSVHNVAMNQVSAAAHYNAERARYAAAVEVSHKWYPLYGLPMIYDAAIHLGELDLYTAARSEAVREHFAQQGSYLYFTPDNGADDEYPSRWDGTIITKGQVIVTDPGGAPLRYALYGQDYGQWDSGNILPGDTIYVKDHMLNPTQGGTWRLDGQVIQYADPVNKYLYSFAGEWVSAGRGAGGVNYVDYCIVRAHRAGVAAGATTTAVVSAGGALAQPKTYRYAWRYGNSRTGYWGNLSASSANASTTAGNQTITVSGWTLPHHDLDVDTLQIYRREMTGTDNTFYLVHTESILDYGAAGGYPTVWHLNTYASYVEAAEPTLGAALPTTTNRMDRPPRMRAIRPWNGRLVGAGVDSEAHWMYQSTVDAWEYFPEVQWDWSGLGTEGDMVGTRVPIGVSAAEPIMAIVPEQGTFSTTGSVGANLLILLPSRAVRWYGTNKDNWRVDEAFPVGTASPASVVNAGGILFWHSGDHTVMLAPGSSQPKRVSLALWPRGTKIEMTVADKNAALLRWCGGFNQGRYLLSGSMSSAVPDTTWILDMETGAWTRMDRGYNDFAQWKKTGAPDGQIVTGSRSVAQVVGGVTTGDLEQLFAATPSGAFRWRSGPLPRYDRESLTRSKYHIARVLAGLKNPIAANQTLTLKVFADGENTTAADTKNRTIALDAVDTGKRTIYEWTPTSGDGDFLQLELLATLTKDLVIEWVRAEYVEHV